MRESGLVTSDHTKRHTTFDGTCDRWSPSWWASGGPIIGDEWFKLVTWRRSDQKTLLWDHNTENGQLTRGKNNRTSLGGVHEVKIHGKCIFVIWKKNQINGDKLENKEIIIILTMIENRKKICSAVLYRAIYSWWRENIDLRVIFGLNTSLSISIDFCPHSAREDKPLRRVMHTMLPLRD